ncbi:MAG: TIR domain-containing protein [Nitrospira sp.]|nr:TIR domain-containing protein [Nitrospira sp.]
MLRKMQPCSVILILAGVYSTYSKWIEKEIKIAKEEFSVQKPIIAIEPRGSERTSQIVKNNADRIVGWNTNSVVDAIRALA